MAEIRINATGELKLYDSDDSRFRDSVKGVYDSDDSVWGDSV